MDDRFHHAFLPPAVRVCGRELRSFTVWHDLILGAIRSPLVTPGMDLRPGDLLVAVRSVRSRYGKPVRFRPSLRDIWWKWRMLRRPALFHREAGKFLAWMKLQASPPQFYKTGGSFSSATIDRGPQCLAIVCSLMERGHMGRAEAWNTNIGEARWMDAQLAQLRGVELHFLDDADLDESPIDLSGLTDEEALTMFIRDLGDNDLARKTFRHWQKHTKRKEAASA